MLEALEGGIDRDRVPDCVLSTAGIETKMFVAAQRACPEVGLLWIAAECREKDVAIQPTLAETRKTAPELWINGQKPAAIERQSLNYEWMPNEVLYRRVYDASDGELQLRPVVPTGGTSQMEVPGVGSRELSLRSRIILEYHNGVLGGHQGRDKTYHRIEQDWWWARHVQGCG